MVLKSIVKVLFNITNIYFPILLVLFTSKLY